MEAARCSCSEGFDAPYPAHLQPYRRRIWVPKWPIQLRADREQRHPIGCHYAGSKGFANWGTVSSAPGRQGGSCPRTVRREGLKFVIAPCRSVLTNQLSICAPTRLVHELVMIRSAPVSFGLRKPPANNTLKSATAAAPDAYDQWHH